MAVHFLQHLLHGALHAHRDKMTGGAVQPQRSDDLDDVILVGNTVIVQDLQHCPRPVTHGIHQGAVKIKKIMLGYHIVPLPCVLYQSHCSRRSGKSQGFSRKTRKKQSLALLFSYIFFLHPSTR